MTSTAAAPRSSRRGDEALRGVAVGNAGGPRRGDLRHVPRRPVVPVDAAGGAAERGDAVDRLDVSLLQWQLLAPVLGSRIPARQADRVRGGIRDSGSSSASCGRGRRRSLLDAPHLGGELLAIADEGRSCPQVDLVRAEAARRPAGAHAPVTDGAPLQLLDQLHDFQTKSTSFFFTVTGSNSG